MFIINPDPYSLPCYRIGPFRTSDLFTNTELSQSDKIDRYFSERFKGREFLYTDNGRKAINLALSNLELSGNDVVTIITTSGNRYISGCVTNEIEKFCKWSMKLTSQTKAIFINHEFGFPYSKIKELKELGLPIIEDCANSFFSKNKGVYPGTTGDFVIYSFPKTFPLQVGGLLVYDQKNMAIECSIDQKLLRYIKSVLSHYIGEEKEIFRKRLWNYNYLKIQFEEIGFKERFNVKDGVMPSVFMFKTEGSSLDLPALKKYFYAHGVQCSVFYGEEAFFIPVHQGLNEVDLQYFVEIFKAFLKLNN